MFSCVCLPLSVRFTKPVSTQSKFIICNLVLRCILDMYCVVEYDFMFIFSFCFCAQHGEWCSRWSQIALHQEIFNWHVGSHMKPFPFSFLKIIIIMGSSPLLCFSSLVSESWNFWSNASWLFTWLCIIEIWIGGLTFHAANVCA